MKGVKLTRNDFVKVQNIDWNDIIFKIEEEFKLDGMIKFKFKDRATPPTFVMHKSDIRPNTLGEAYDEVFDKYDITEMHVYVSFGETDALFGRHKDDMNVLIVQSKGSVSYRFDDGSIYTLNPGDSIFIPEGIYHDAIVTESRLTLSFSWEKL